MDFQPDPYPSAPTAASRQNPHQTLQRSRREQGIEPRHLGLQGIRPSSRADRLGVLEQMAQGLNRTNPAAAAAAQRTVYQRAVELMRSEKRGPSTQPGARENPFHVRPQRLRSGVFACAGSSKPTCRSWKSIVPTPGGWDVHTPQRVNEVKNLALPHLDRGMSALLQDLETRGLLDNTLVIWMGEFGRTPRLNSSTADATIMAGPGRRSCLAAASRRAIIGRTDPMRATARRPTHYRARFHGDRICLCSA